MQNYNAKKLEILYKPINISFEEIMLLSKNEYLENKELIPLLKNAWWLRSRGFTSNQVAFIDSVFGAIDVFGNLISEVFSVRPVLKMRSHYDLIPGDKIKISEYIFTVLHGNLVLCDTFIGKSIFDHETNEFETSAIKKYLYDWAEQNNITFEKF